MPTLTELDRQRLRLLDVIYRHSGLTPEEFDKLDSRVQQRLLNHAEHPADFQHIVNQTGLETYIQTPDPTVHEYVSITYRDDRGNVVTMEPEAFWRQHPHLYPPNRVKHTGEQLELPL
jgi:hypothetical protein